MLGINNEDCFKTIQKIQDQGRKVGLVLTSPPYNTGRNSTDSKRRNAHEVRYDIHLDNMTDSEYLDWTTALFHGFDSILRKNGVVLYNMSYGTDIKNTKEDYKPNEIMYKVISKILSDTAFTIADTIVWKKSTALPNNTSKNKLTRLCEFVYVFVRKSELKSFDPFLGTGSTGVACEMLGIKWLGSEISTAQCEYARKRLEDLKNG